MPEPFRSSNPALNSRTFAGRELTAGPAMTLQGTINRTGVLLLCVIVTAGWTWGIARSQSPQAVTPWMLGGLIGGLVFAMVTIFKKEWSPFTAPIYALLEGLALGGISSLIDQQYHGIAVQAVALTFGTLAVMLVAYTTGLIRPTERFKMGVVVATGGILVVYLADIVMGFFGHPISVLNSSGPWGIAISVVIVIVAALNLILDFDLIQQGIQVGAPKYMEWYGAFGLMVTLIWLYLEFLRLLSKARRR
jgi:uncharacterized YccA/Bax inhibitor family protein